MADETATVDSVEETASAETDANVEVNPSMEGSSPKAAKTYTEAEHDAIVKARIDKQNAKHAVEMDEKQQALDAANAELAAYKAKEALDSARKAAADEYGVPVERLDGASESEILAQARAVKSVMESVPMFQAYPDSGEGKSPTAVTKESILAIKNERERLQAIRENAQLFSN